MTNHLHDNKSIDVYITHLYEAGGGSGGIGEKHVCVGKLSGDFSNLNSITFATETWSTKDAMLAMKSIAIDQISLDAKHGE